MATVGEILRRERERQGLGLPLIAQQTRIKLQYLEALERDDFERLPGRFFARSFTTQYADRLGVTSEELSAAVERQLTPAEAFPAAHDTAPVNTRIFNDRFSVDPLPDGTASALSAKKLTASVVMLVAVVMACGAVFWLWQRAETTTATASSGIVPASPTPQPVPVTQVSPPAAQPVITETKSDPAQQAPTQNANLNPVPTPTPAPVAPIDDYSQSGKIKLQVTAKEDTWLRITVDGKVTVERVLARGESSLAAANGSAKILLGNAGGVDIRFNGADIGMVGPRGQVRTVDFTPEKHTVIEPPKKPAPASDAQTAPQPVAESNGF